MSDFGTFVLKQLPPPPRARARDRVRPRGRSRRAARRRGLRRARRRPACARGRALPAGDVPGAGYRASGMPSSRVACCTTCTRSTRGSTCSRRSRRSSSSTSSPAIASIAPRRTGTRASTGCCARAGADPYGPGRPRRVARAPSRSPSAHDAARRRCALATTSACSSGCRTSHRWLGGPSSESLEQTLIDAELIPAIGYRWAGASTSTTRSSAPSR